MFLEGNCRWVPRWVSLVRITKAINLTTLFLENCSKCTNDDILNLIRLVRIELNLLL